MNDVYPRRRRRRHADAGRGRSVHHRVLRRAVARRATPLAITARGQRRIAVVAQRPQPHGRDRDLARRRRRDGAPTLRARSRSGGAKDAWPMWAADGEDALLHVRSQRRAEHLGDAAAVRARARARAKALTPFNDGRVLWPSITRDGKTIAFERDFAIWRSIPRAGRRARCRSRCAARPPRPAVEHRTLHRSVPGAGALARRKEGRVHRRTARSSRRRRRTAGTRCASRTTAGEEAQIVWAPDSRRLVYVVAIATATNHLVHLRLRQRQGNAAHQRRRRRRSAALFAGRQVDRVRAQRQRAAGDRSRLARGEAACAPVCSTTRRSTMRATSPGRPMAVDRLSQRRRQDVSERARRPVPAAARHGRSASSRTPTPVAVVEPGRRISHVRDTAAHRAGRCRCGSICSADAEVPRRSIPRSVPRRTAPDAGPSGDPSAAPSPARRRSAAPAAPAPPAPKRRRDRVRGNPPPR